MTEFATTHAQNELLKLARQGRLVDQAFKYFQRQVFPDAPPDQVAVMRTCFFGGAAELHAIFMVGLEEGDEPTDNDLAFMSMWVEELERFHARTIAASKAKGARQ